MRPWLAEALIGELESTTIQVVRLGPLLLLGAPADLGTSVGMPVMEEARRRGYRPLFVSMAEDWVGYVLSEAEYRQAEFKLMSQLHGPAMGPYFELLYKKIVAELDRPRMPAGDD